MQHPKALLLSVVVVALVVAIVYYFSVVIGSKPEPAATTEMSPEQIDARLESLKSPDSRGSGDAAITAEQNSQLESLKSSEGSGDGSVNNSLLDSLKTQ